MEKINAVEMVRKIRDKQYEETKNMPREELLKYFKKNGEKALLNFEGRLSRIILRSLDDMQEKNPKDLQFEIRNLPFFRLFTSCSRLTVVLLIAHSLPLFALPPASTPW